MNGIAAALILGFLLATAYGAGFHLILGGPAKRILLYVGAAWVGFLLGQIIGAVLNISLFKMGALYLFSASLGSWIALISSRWLVAINES